MERYEAGARPAPVDDVVGRGPAAGLEVRAEPDGVAVAVELVLVLMLERGTDAGADLVGAVGGVVAAVSGDRVDGVVGGDDVQAASVTHAPMAVSRRGRPFMVRR